jgi:hypothetical protein
MYEFSIIFSQLLRTKSIINFPIYGELYFLHLRYLNMKDNFRYPFLF